MAAVRDKGEGEKSAFRRWLHAARYVVSAVVIVLIVAVAAKAIMVVLRPDTLALSVAGSTVYTRWFRGNQLVFYFNLGAENPSGRALMYYSNITAYLFDNSTPPATSPSPSDHCLIFFELKDMVVVQMQYSDQIFSSDMVSRDPGVIVTSFFDALKKPGARIDGVTMRVDGTLVTELRSGYNATPQPTTYYCRQLIVGLNLEDKASVSSQATSCTTS